MVLVYYWLNKKIISIETFGGMTLGLSFKRSVIENVPVDITLATKAIRIINDKVVGKNSVGST